MESTSTSFHHKIRFLVIRLIVPAIIDALFFFLPRKRKTLLVVKNDGIGDYILFRNYLSFLKQSDKYGSYKIYLLGGGTSKELAMHFDDEIVDGFFWYREGSFLKWGLVKLLFSLQRLRPETILYPNYSRRFETDWLINHVRAAHKIAVGGDWVNQTVSSRNHTDAYYTELVVFDARQKHEFERNRFFFEQVTAEKCGFPAPILPKSKLAIVSNQSVVFFTGASAPGKKWPAVNFNLLAGRITRELNLPVILAEGKYEVGEEKVILDGLPDGMFSSRQGLDMIRLCDLIGGATLLVSGDTVAIHLAAALAVPAVCICKGDLYGRFVPYPGHISDKVSCVFPRKYVADAENYDQWSPMDVSEISADDVFHRVKKMLVDFPVNEDETARS